MTIEQLILRASTIGPVMVHCGTNQILRKVLKVLEIPVTDYIPDERTSFLLYWKFGKAEQRLEAMLTMLCDIENILEVHLEDLPELKSMAKKAPYVTLPNGYRWATDTPTGANIKAKAEPPTVYISGPISGLDYEVAKQRFADVEKQLLDLGYKVINPITLVPYNESFDWVDYMLFDIDALIKECSIVVMLPEWESSKGARIEHQIAASMGRQVYMPGELPDSFGFKLHTSTRRLHRQGDISEDILREIRARLAKKLAALDTKPVESKLEHKEDLTSLYTFIGGMVIGLIIAWVNHI